MRSETATETVRIDADFPGGNILVEAIEGDTVRLHQDLRDTEGDWFYWCFRVRGAAGRTLTFQFTHGNVIGVRGPAVSTDGGKRWKWLGAAAVDGSRFRYHFAANATEVRFCFAVPYLESDLRAFLARHRDSPFLRVERLCRTRKGRDAELLRLGKLTGEPEHRVLLTARHHCCESLAGYALEGILAEVLSGEEDGAWLREHVEFFVVPFVDKDGVEEGDQGKNRRPRDHNRDYSGESIHPTVQAIRERVPAWSAGRLRFALDLHCPHIRGAHNEAVYFVGTRNQENWRRVQAFAALLEQTQTGPIPYRTADNLPYGEGWNTDQSSIQGKKFSAWASELPEIRFASTIEIAYANANGAEVNAESARALGRDLARALRLFLLRAA